MNLIHTSKCVCTKSIIRDPNTINRESPSCSVRFTISFYLNPNNLIITSSRSDLVWSVKYYIWKSIQVIIITIYEPVDQLACPNTPDGNSLGWHRKWLFDTVVLLQNAYKRVNVVIHSLFHLCVAVKRLFQRFILQYKVLQEIMGLFRVIGWTAPPRKNLNILDNFHPSLQLQASPEIASVVEACESLLGNICLNQLLNWAHWDYQQRIKVLFFKLFEKEKRIFKEVIRHRQGFLSAWISRVDCEKSAKRNA